MAPSFAPTSMNAAITSVYIVIALCTPVTVVFRSATIREIETFITLESSTMMNWAAARMISGSHLRTAGLYGVELQLRPPVRTNAGAGARTVENRDFERCQHRSVPSRSLSLVERLVDRGPERERDADTCRMRFVKPRGDSRSTARRRGN